MPRRALTVLLAAAAGAGPAAAQTPAAVYRDTCATCHDSGAGQAPRLTDRDDWQRRAARGRDALYRGALLGVPNTPMVAKGGFGALSDDLVRAVVDYMLAAAGQASAVARARPPAAAGGAGPAATLPAAAPGGDDTAITAAVAARVRAAHAPPGATLDVYDGVTTIRGLGVKVETRAGVVVLSGALEHAELIERIARLAAQVPGVTGVVNRMIAAAMLDWD
ncbi:MAG: BON domain-containing protein [Burkholderiales bacterium]|nr:BON domain-containing protein [Burkholderiales bacterium]